MRQARNHATHFKCQERRLQQQPKPDLRDLRFSWYPWQKSTAIHLTPHVPGARSNEQLAQTEQAFLSQHRKDFWLSCMGVEKMWWWWVGHSGTCSSEMKTISYFISVLFIYALTQRDTKGIHTHTKKQLAHHTSHRKVMVSKCWWVNPVVNIKI